MRAANVSLELVAAGASLTYCFDGAGSDMWWITRERGRIPAALGGGACAWCGDGLPPRDVTVGGSFLVLKSRQFVVSGKAQGRIVCFAPLTNEAMESFGGGLMSEFGRMKVSPLWTEEMVKLVVCLNRGAFSSGKKCKCVGSETLCSQCGLLGRKNRLWHGFLLVPRGDEVVLPPGWFSVPCGTHYFESRKVGLFDLVADAVALHVVQSGDALGEWCGACVEVKPM